MSTTPPLTLHIWPGAWGLPSREPASLAAALYLQLALPGRFALQACADPDASPTGQLPYLTHGHHAVGGFASVARYVAGLAPASVPRVAREDGTTDNDDDDPFSADVDVMLSAQERAQRTAWLAHAERALGDLVAHVFFSLPANYDALTGPTLAALYGAPQRLYVPARVRAAYQARLEASGLWALPGEEVEEEAPAPRKFGDKKEEKKQDPKRTFKSAFERERVLERARAAFDLYARLLGDKRYFFYDRPTSLDLVLAAHVLLLVDAPLPDPLLAPLLSNTHPTLLAHARRVLAAAAPRTPTLPTPGYSLSALLPYPSVRAWWARCGAETSAEERRYARARWHWAGLALLGAVGYVALYAPRMRVVRVRDADGDVQLGFVVGDGDVGDAEEEEEEVEAGAGEGAAEQT
ncbi:hypothetical protein BC834DRAFT_971359 [Gloeopeniophorella convolvens]|nr:hypothetical protein BC834DRAFT_971359 [Gloeopeniophorella convolvens]